MAGIAAAACLALAPSAHADFGLSEFEVTFKNPDGTPATQAGSHPFAMVTDVTVNFHEEEGEFVPDGGDIKDLVLTQVRGFTGDTDAVPRCTTLDFATLVGGLSACGDETAVGVNRSILVTPFGAGTPVPVYNLVPPPGVPVRLGFVTSGVPLVIDVSVKPAPDYNVVARGSNIPQPLTVFGAVTELWGVPADEAHDPERGRCAIVGGSCDAEAPEEPFLVLPRSCEGGLATEFALDPWSDPGAWVRGSVPLDPFEGCGKLPFIPGISALPTADTAETGTGLDFVLDFVDEVDGSGRGLTEPDGIAQSDLKDIAVTLPEGITLNPSIGEGLGVCTPADLQRETLAAEAGEGCPNASKIGTVKVQTPIVDREIPGSVYLAQQDDPNTSAPGAENPFDTLIAFYIVLREPDLGALVKVPARVEPDPVTGQLVTTVEDSPQVPFERFFFHFREGQRAPLVTPPACGTYEVVSEITPRARPSEVLTRTASFQITRGIGGGACPPGGMPPFHPGYEAGSLNNNAASHSPFYMRLTRADGEQDMTKFSSVLPPGVIGSLRGVSKCPDAAIEAAKPRTGRQELASPSCPANSRIGRTLAGAGVGAALTYVPGQIYLAGPYKGAPLSVVSITPAVAGPFDAGTVVVRLGLDLNPTTAEVEVDGAASDPIPHIIKGIVLKARDLRVYVDRERFILNPTSCEESTVRAQLFGSYLDVFSPLDDVPADLAARYQAANCASLAFKPRLKLNLKGGSKRGGHPGLRAIYTPRPGDANLAAAQATLPRSAFLDQAHIRTICTRVQFAAEQCPKGSVYGFAKAWTPLLDEVLEGPVILRSSSNKLPDLVLALEGIVDVNVVSRIDSKNGGIRNTFDIVPDAPVSRFLLTLRGGRKGLIVNSRDLCKGRTSRAKVRFRAHNGRLRVVRTKLKPQCRKGKRARKSRRR